METVQLKLSLVGTDALEEALIDLQTWLEDDGIDVQPALEPLAEGELGEKTTALLLVVSIIGETSHLPSGVEEGLHAVHTWQQQHPTIQAIVHPTGHNKLDEEMDRFIRREHLHIELREPEPPPRKEVYAVASPPKKN